MTSRAAVVLLWAALVAAPPAALAHTRSQSFSTWSMADRELRAVITVPAMRRRRSADSTVESSIAPSVSSAPRGSVLQLSSPTGIVLGTSSSTWSVGRPSVACA